MSETSKVTDTARLDWLETQDGAALLSDDFGHWCVSWDGTQNVPGEAPADIVTTHFVEKGRWRPSIREAIDAAMASEGEEPSEVEHLKTTLARVMKLEFIDEWLATPKDALGGVSPLEALEAGQWLKVWRMAWLIGSGTPI